MSELSSGDSKNIIENREIDFEHDYLTQKERTEKIWAHQDEAMEHTRKRWVQDSMHWNRLKRQDKQLATNLNIANWTNCICAICAIITAVSALNKNVR